MKQFFFRNLLIIILFSSCKQPSIRAISYGNDMFSIHLNKYNDSVCAFKLIDEVSGKKIEGCAKLITIENEVPGCGLVVDYNNTDFIYQCDSTYGFVSNSFKMSFAMEKGSKERMDMQIWQSTLNNFLEGEYTLYRLNKK